ncbi:MAG: hypothetical protein Q9187_006396 [Circinaria calcarea]
MSPRLEAPFPSYSRMQILRLGALALGLSTATAFQDTSPLIFFSTSEILASSPKIVSAFSLTQTLASVLEKCPSDVYVIVSQPGVSAVDYKAKLSSPHLQRWISGEDSRIRSSFTVTDVLGEIDTPALVRTLEERCGAGTLSVDASSKYLIRPKTELRDLYTTASYKVLLEMMANRRSLAGLFDIVDDMKPRIIKLDFPALPTGPSRSEVLYENGNSHPFPHHSKTNLIPGPFLASILDVLSSPNFTVIYTTTPLLTPHQALMAESKFYEMDQPSMLSAHMEMKRDLSAFGNSTNRNSTLPPGPLFERYQFFTPGLFMGLVVGLLLFSILYVGISALSSLQVSYAAFDKEMGPAAQKKQQQQ